jgi:hypothetical protein
MQNIARAGRSLRAATRARARATTVAFVTSFLLCSTGCTRIGTLPAAPRGLQSEASGPEAAAIEQREICVGSKIESSGRLADALYYQATVLPSGKLAVGYFAFFSDERPWANNWLTWTLVPALAIDMFYTRAAFLGPGLQRALSGKGDVEGFRVIYDVRPDGSLVVESAMADDGTHDPVRLEAKDILALDPERPTFYSNVWSHQLGGRGVTSMADLAYVRCYGPGRVLPLSDAVFDEFALRGRAQPAHVEALGGRPIGVPDQRWASNKPAGSSVRVVARQITSPSGARTPKR